MKLKKCSLEKIINNNTKIVCFGSGEGLSIFCQAFQYLNIQDYIEVIIDNNPKTHNTYKKLNDKKILIINLDEYINNSKYTKNALIITSTFLKEILSQLGKYEALQYISCYYYHEIIAHNSLNRNKGLPDSIRICDTQLIPKKIHYCWFGKGKKSSLNKKCIQSWKKFCPDYEIIEWNEENYDISKNSFMLQAYKEKRWAFVADPARLDIIYQHGGIYLDTDVKLLQNIDNLLYQPAFAGVDSSKRISFGLGFGSIPQNEAIKNMFSLWDNANMNQSVQEIILPNMMKSYFEKLGYDSKKGFQIINNITIYPEIVLSAYNPHLQEYYRCKNAYMAHLYEGSWIDKEGKKRKMKWKENYQIMKEHGII